ncbi:MraY family glycosyltransferase [Gracilimonas halophila]|uniref:MraY family glycosyltransferase n=1 Tax=Gracilimonas halophila TaxID=1834464 RepID=A0ABW5JLS2_9BACT
MDAVLIQVLAGTIIAFIITYFTIPILKKVAYLTDLYDKPDNERKVHDRYVPTLGGIAIFIAFFVGFSLSGMAEQIIGYPYLAAGLLMLFFTGLKDDIVDLSAKIKLGVELTVAALLIFGCNMYISNFYGVFGIYEIPFWAGALVTGFTMIVVVNSFNLIDGIDGLAGGVGIIASIAFGIGFLIAGEFALATLSLVLFSTLTAFLLYNYNPASIFMGDTGSLVVGFLLSVLAINFVGLNENPAYTAALGYTSPILPIAILALPLFDTITVFYKRIRNGRSPFSPGQDHIHHSVLRAGFGHKGTTAILYFCNLFIIMLTLSVRSLDIHVGLAMAILSMFMLLPTNGFKRNILKKMGIELERNTLYGKDMQNLQTEERAFESNGSSSTRQKAKSEQAV